MEVPNYDLRLWPVGGWPLSKTHAKVNGRLAYFYRPDGEMPWNTPEPIDFAGPYIPPNHQDEPFQVYPEVPAHPIRQRMLAAIRRPRAPLAFRADRGRALVPPAWRNSVIVAQDGDGTAKPRLRPGASSMPAIHTFPQSQSEQKPDCHSSISVQTESDPERSSARPL
jgi:hypothetical protein